MSRRRSSSSSNGLLQSLIEFTALLIRLFVILCFTVIELLIRLIFFTYDFITFNTSQYKEKSGNSFIKTYFNKGNYGEFLLFRKLVKIFGKENVYANIYLDNEATDYTEVDIVAVSQFGIFVFEMKNFSGYIYGSEEDLNWTQVLNKFSKYKFYNPIRQNATHAKAMGNYLSVDENKIVPVIVFSNHSKLRLKLNSDIKIIKLNSIKKFIKNYNKTNLIHFTDEEISTIGSKLYSRSNMSDEIKELHIQQVKDIRERFR